MNKLSLILLFFVTLSYAGIVEDFMNKKYAKICNFNNIRTYLKDEKMLSIIGVSCVRSDKLFLLPFIVNKLKKTSYGRKNAIYFITIFMEKKLLYSYLFDDFDISSFSFPKTDYILSIVFDAVKNKKYVRKDNFIIVNDKNISYYIYKKNDKMIIDKFEKDKLIKRYWYR